jgi:hypothetical protein
MQMMMQMGQMAMQLPQQIGGMLAQAPQQLMQPLHEAGRGSTSRAAHARKVSPCAFVQRGGRQGTDMIGQIG